MAKKKRKTTSSLDILLQIADDKSLKDNLTIKKLVTSLGRRTYGLLILIFALPSALPFSLIPGFSIIFSIPLVIISTQLMIGRKAVWLPKILGEKQISHEHLAKIIKATEPYLRKIERLLKDRWFFMTNNITESLTGFILIVLSILIMLPIPLTNSIIAAIVVLFGLGIAEDDGLVIAIAWVSALVSLIFIQAFLIKLVTYFF